MTYPLGFIVEQRGAQLTPGLSDQQILTDALTAYFEDEANTETLAALVEHLTETDPLFEAWRTADPQAWAARTHTHSDYLETESDPVFATWRDAGHTHAVTDIPNLWHREVDATITYPLNTDEDHQYGIGTETAHPKWAYITELSTGFIRAITDGGPVLASGAWSKSNTLAWSIDFTGATFPGTNPWADADHTHEGGGGGIETETDPVFVAWRDGTYATWVNNTYANHTHTENDPEFIAWRDATTPEWAARTHTHDYAATSHTHAVTDIPNLWHREVDATITYPLNTDEDHQYGIGTETAHPKWAYITELSTGFIRAITDGGPVLASGAWSKSNTLAWSIDFTGATFPGTNPWADADHTHEGGGGGIETETDPIFVTWRDEATAYLAPGDLDGITAITRDASNRTLPITFASYVRPLANTDINFGAPGNRFNEFYTHNLDLDVTLSFYGTSAGIDWTNYTNKGGTEPWTSVGYLTTFEETDPTFVEWRDATTPAWAARTHTHDYAATSHTHPAPDTNVYATREWANSRFSLTSHGHGLPAGVVTEDEWTERIANYSRTDHTHPGGGGGLVLGLTYLIW